MRRVAAVLGLVMPAGAPACAHPSHLGVAPAYPAYGPAPYAALPWNRVGGHHHHAAARHHHGNGHGARHHGSGGHHVAPNHGHHRPHHQPHHQQRRH